jgi:hypothetical protein
MLRTPLTGLTALLGLSCATAMPEAAEVSGDTGGLTAATGICTDRMAQVGVAPVERGMLNLSCEGPNSEGRLDTCSEASLVLRDALGGMLYLDGLSELDLRLTQPSTEGGRSQIHIQAARSSERLADGLVPQLRIDLPTYLAHQSLPVVAEGGLNSCTATDGCAIVGLDAIKPIGTSQYPLGTAASGVFLIDGIGWASDRVEIDLEVPFFVPDTEQAAVCDDHLIHYTTQAQ